MVLSSHPLEALLSTSSHLISLKPESEDICSDFSLHSFNVSGSLLSLSLRSELNEYWQKIIAIEKVTDFNKHHCCQELKEFLEVEANTKKVIT